MLRLAMGKPWRQTEGMLALHHPDARSRSSGTTPTVSRRDARLSLTTALKKPKGPVDAVVGEQRAEDLWCGASG